MSGVSLSNDKVSFVIEISTHASILGMLSGSFKLMHQARERLTRPDFAEIKIGT